ncbi:lysophospholipid acyltransferase family protein [Anaerosinus massiliensis]|uniref:lysophospholipid acyltransferase family protein n=1 Tax=Massilibacillus massiliensis TaxID=1806837 RepID=UPI000AF0AB85|nr:lysophospholipid acyltransferase family protein [Massilibacillus massiliensis]
MAYVCIKLFSRFICFLPVSLQNKIGAFIGHTTWMVVPAKRKWMAVQNIVAALGVEQAAAAEVAKCSWTRFGKMLMEVMAFPKIKKNVDHYVKIQGKEYMEQALAYGNGVVLATAHSGNWELLGGALALHGYPIVAVAQKQTNGDMDRLINEYRTMVGMHVTYKNGVREMIKMLGQGSVIGLLMDQDAGNDGVELEFFGRRAFCPQGPAFLARMKNAPLLPTFITENTDGTHTILIQEPFFVEKTEDKQRDIKETTKKLTEIIEKHIQKHPTEWFWMHNRWKKH